MTMLNQNGFFDFEEPIVRALKKLERARLKGGAKRTELDRLEQELERAYKIVEALGEAGGGVVLVDGKMVDRPVVLSAQRLIAQAEAAGRA